MVVLNLELFLDRKIKCLKDLVTLLEYRKIKIPLVYQLVKEQGHDFTQSLTMILEQIKQIMKITKNKRSHKRK